MYSAKVNDQPTTFGTSGLLYRSNKLMYDRATETIWHQFTGEPVIGPLADSGITLDFFPSVLTTWGEWIAQHADTTVLALNTGVYLPGFYRPEDEPGAFYYEYFHGSDNTMFPVWNKSDALKNKERVVGLSVGEDHKAYQVEALRRDRVLNDTVGQQDVVVIASSHSEEARVYERDGHEFSLGPDESEIGPVPSEVQNTDGVVWRVTEESLVNQDDPTQELARIPTRNSFWLGWSSFHPDTELHALDGQ